MIKDWKTSLFGLISAVAYIAIKYFIGGQIDIGDLALGGNFLGLGILSSDSKNSK